MVRVVLHISGVVFLTLLTQLGGIAWMIGLCFRRRVLAFLASYAALSATALMIAPMFGRVAIPCMAQGDLRMTSPIYCVLNRQYVTPELQDVLLDFSGDMASQFPDTTTLVLDANFPFIDGFPLLPHLSHDDGEKVDLAFFYKDGLGCLHKTTKSPVGYFAFEDGPTNCPERKLSLRWDFAALQPLCPPYDLEHLRMKAALDLLSADARVGKVFIEPHLKTRFDAQSAKIRFQGCRAARHDDHIHLQL